MGGEEYFHFDMVLKPPKLAQYQIQHPPVAQGKKTGHILEEKRLRLELLKEADVVAKELVARVVEEAAWGIDREALARRPSNKNVKLALAKREHFSDVRRSHILDAAAFRPHVRMICAKRLDRLRHHVVRVETLKARLSKTLGDAAGPAK
jgi:hypothetical protein